MRKKPRRKIEKLIRKLYIMMKWQWKKITFVRANIEPSSASAKWKKKENCHWKKKYRKYYRARIKTYTSSRIQISVDNDNDDDRLQHVSVPYFFYSW